MQDILDAIGVIEKHLAKRKLHELNELELAGILRYLEVIGEASHSISFDLKQKYNQIPWKLIKDFRNILVHQYFEVDLKIVENTIDKEIPFLKQNIVQVLKELA